MRGGGSKSINITKRGSCFKFFYSYSVVRTKMGLHYSLDPKVLGFRSPLRKCLDTKQHIYALKTQFYPSSFLVPKAGLRESAPQRMAEAWGVSTVPTGSLCLLHLQHRNFSTEAKAGSSPYAPTQDLSGSESDTLLPGRAHFRLQSFTYPRP